MSFDAADVVWTNGSSPTLYAETPPSRAGFNSSNLTAVPDNHTHTNHTAPLDLSRAVPVGMVLAFFIMFAIVGNILVILSVVCNRHLRIPTNYFIINLAIADLLLGTTVLPVSATLEVLDYWVFGRIFCDIWAAVDVLCCTASIMSLCVISIDRYIGVRYPLQYPMIVTEKRALLAMLGVWILAIVISIGPLLGWKQPPSQDDTECLITEEPFYALFSSLGSFYIPLAVILAMYCRVYVVAKRTTKNLEAGVMKERVEDSNELTMRIHCKNQDMSASGGGGSKGGGGAAGRSTLTVKLLKFSREKKAAKTLGVVVGMFILCWLPFFLALPIVDRCDEETPSLPTITAAQVCGELRRLRPSKTAGPDGVSPRLLKACASSSSVWLTEADCDLHNLPRALLKYQTSTAHIRSQIALSTFGKSWTDTALDEQLRLHITAHNEKESIAIAPLNHLIYSVLVQSRVTRASQ
ncbi:alpha-1B adrenergic receptor-like [Myripristis murdjan]|uniref:alpha-1B adrenergic receptor-like n=1 Tax=Myripristis murdjan TaxID=586833 RepID=UPI0011760AEC|nr:alpha-1B adrenergic receptor-like [Myripristis murdjan]